MSGYLGISKYLQYIDYISTGRGRVPLRLPPALQRHAGRGGAVPGQVLQQRRGGAEGAGDRGQRGARQVNKCIINSTKPEQNAFKN